MFSLTVSYSDYLKRDDQLLAFRLQNEEARNRMAKTAKDRDRALAMGKTNELGEPDTEIDGEEEAEETPTEALGSKVIVIHVGSQNLRIGLASDALPKTVPMVIARKSTGSESEEEEPKPKRLKLDDGSLMEPEKMFGPEVRFMEGALNVTYVSLTSSCSLPHSIRQWPRSSRHTCDKTNGGLSQIQRKW